MELLHHLDQGSAIVTLKDRGEMPLTIQHAMDLSTRLRERYFWVDTLCIIQDDDGPKHSELRKMAGIYSHATLTIVAANGDSAMCGLLGIPGISGPRQIKRYPFRLGRDATIIQYPLLGDNGSETIKIYESRGWTFQEQTFSRRKLIFYDGFVGWECNDCFKMEYFNSDKVRDQNTRRHWILTKTPSNALINTSNIIPSVHEWMSAVKPFISRNLSCPADVLDAFSGILAVLELRYGEGLISGIPTIQFNLALLWESGRVVRRTSNTDSAKAFPTWSWVGWQGEISFPHWANNWWKRSINTSRDWMEPNGDRERIWSSIQWYTHEKLGDKGAPVPCQWFDLEEQFQGNTNEEVPDGWKRWLRSDLTSIAHFCRSCYKLSLRHGVSASNELDLQPCPAGHDLCDLTRWLNRLFYYTHESDLQHLYTFPIPLSSCSRTRSIEPLFISWVTNSVWFWTRYQRSSTGSVTICDENDKHVGKIKLTMWDDRLVSYGLRVPIELVELAQGGYFNSSESVNDTTRYIVMWIERQGGVAYRRGIGQINQDAWENAEKTRMNLTLG